MSRDSIISSMPITLLQPLPVGNAIRVFVTPPDGITRWRILRNTTGLFPAFDDPASSVIHDGSDMVALDTQGLLNGTTYHYGLFCLNWATWEFDNNLSEVPMATFEQLGLDVMSVVRDRLDLGLQVILARGVVGNVGGKINVLTAPPTFDQAIWPLVTVHVQQDASNERFVGEQIQPDYFDGEDWQSFEGWLSRWSLQIVAWCLNPDERIAMRKAIKDVLIANMPVFDEAGMVQIDVSQSDAEDFERYNAPVYQAMTTLTCLAPSAINGLDNAITDVVSTIVP